MTKLEQLRLVIELACLTEDRTKAEQTALLAIAHRADSDANAQVSNNSVLRGVIPSECTYRPGPPETHDRPHDNCKCAPAVKGAPRLLVRMPPGGWWRLAEDVAETWTPEGVPA